MSINFSRRHCLKLISSAGALSLLPLQFSSANEIGQVFVISNGERIERIFVNAISELTPINTLRISNKNYDTLISLAHLPANSILLGLVNDAEKVLIDSIIHDQRGVIRTIGRVNKLTATDAQVAHLAAAANAMPLTNLDNHTATGSTDKYGSLISFYAQL